MSLKPELQPERIAAHENSPTQAVLHARDAGKSLLPFARVQKIIKADKDIPIVTKEAVFLISLATEEFIKRLTQASRRVAGGEKRITVQQRDIATIVHSANEFVFLEEIIPRPEPSNKKLHVFKSNKGNTNAQSADTSIPEGFGVVEKSD